MASEGDDDGLFVRRENGRNRVLGSYRGVGGAGPSLPLKNGLGGTP
jgi:hypothetical protein